MSSHGSARPSKEYSQVQGKVLRNTNHGIFLECKVSSGITVFAKLESNSNLIEGSRVLVDLKHSEESKVWTAREVSQPVGPENQRHSDGTSRKQNYRKDQLHSKEGPFSRHRQTSGCYKQEKPVSSQKATSPRGPPVKETSDGQGLINLTQNVSRRAPRRFQRAKEVQIVSEDSSKSNSRRTTHEIISSASKDMILTIIQNDKTTSSVKNPGSPENLAMVPPKTEDPFSAPELGHVNDSDGKQVEDTGEQAASVDDGNNVGDDQGGFTYSSVSIIENCTEIPQEDGVKVLSFQRQSLEKNETMTHHIPHSPEMVKLHYCVADSPGFQVGVPTAHSCGDDSAETVTYHSTRSPGMVRLPHFVSPHVSETDAPQNDVIEEEIESKSDVYVTVDDLDLEGTDDAAKESSDDITPHVSIQELPIAEGHGFTEEAIETWVTTNWENIEIVLSDFLHFLSFPGGHQALISGFKDRCLSK